MTEIRGNSGNMKAYRVWDSEAVEGYSTVVFAENASKAKRMAMRTDTCEDAEYINIRARRFPEMDDKYRGAWEIDWYNDDDRRALVEAWMVVLRNELGMRRLCGTGHMQ